MRDFILIHVFSRLTCGGGGWGGAGGAVGAGGWRGRWRLCRRAGFCGEKCRCETERRAKESLGCDRGCFGD